MKRTIKMAVFAFSLMAFCGVLLTGCPKDDPDSDTDTENKDSSTEVTIGEDTLVSGTINSSENAEGTSGSSGVMLQGFTWSSNWSSRYGSGSSGSDWYTVVSNNISDIKDNFEYIWLPPPSDSDSVNGYMPRKLNELGSDYGSSSYLISLLTTLNSNNVSPIADIVINHRVGTSNWGTFTEPSWCDDYYAICSDDEGFSNSSSDMYGSSKTGAEDSGEGYSSARDLDHSNSAVKSGIVSWMADYLVYNGFKGWRYDYVKGYAGQYVGYYNKQTSAAFSVGEYWPSDGFSSSSPSSWYNQLLAWVKDTNGTINGTSGTPSRVFDFVLKGMLNTVFGSSTDFTSTNDVSDGNYSLLASSYNIYASYPGYAVTFVDNHDTGSTQNLWAIDPYDVATAYAFILTHPGYPCVAWNHYFTSSESCDTDSSMMYKNDSGVTTKNTDQYLGGNTVSLQNGTYNGVGTSPTLKSFIKALIALRAEVGITDLSTVTTWSETSSTQYLAEVSGTNGSVLVSIGSSLYDSLSSNAGTSSYSEKSFSSYTLAFQGKKFKIWYATK